MREDKRSALGVELGVKDLQIVALPTADFPISPKEHGTAFLMAQRHLWLRSKKQVAILRVRHEIIRQIRNYFDCHGFTLMDAPIFTPNACEGTTNLFEVDYFDDKAYLTQSGQLYGEAGAMALGRIYTFGPTFRAEKSKTRRHLTEFWMVEPEVAYIDLDGDMDLAEDFLVEVVQSVLEEPPRPSSRSSSATCRSSSACRSRSRASATKRRSRSCTRRARTPSSATTSAPTRRRRSPRSSIARS